MNQSTGEFILFPTLLPMGDHAGAPAIELKRTLVVLGSREDAHIHMQSRTVSRSHAVIVVEPWGASIHDLASRTGVIVNDQPIHDADLEDGDEVQIGRFVFLYQAGSLDPSLGPGPAAPPAHLRLGRKTVPLAQRVATIGTRTASDVLLPHGTAEPTHAIIYVHQGQHVLRDVSAGAGLMLNGKPLHRKMALADGDVIRIGPTALRYVAGRASAGPELPAEDAMEAAMIGAAMGGDCDEDESMVADPLPEPVMNADSSDQHAESVEPIPLETPRPEPPAPEDEAPVPLPVDLPRQTPASQEPSEPATEPSTPPEPAPVEPLPVEPLPVEPASAPLHRPRDQHDALPPLEQRIDDPGDLPRGADGSVAGLAFQPDAAPDDVQTQVIDAEPLEDAPAPLPVEMPPEEASPLPDATEQPAPFPVEAGPGNADTPPERVGSIDACDLVIVGALGRPLNPPEHDPVSAPLGADAPPPPNGGVPRPLPRPVRHPEQETFIAMPPGEVDTVIDPYTLGSVYHPHGRRLRGLIMSYQISTVLASSARRRPDYPPRVPPRVH